MKSWMSLVTGHLLGDAIITDESEAIITNDVETYCRLPSIDAHFEDMNEQSSLPNFTSQYPNRLSIGLMSYDNSRKLTIGTNAFNALVISSIRLDDSKTPSEVGASTKHFTPSSNSRIFLSTSSIEKANQLANDNNREHIPSSDDPFNMIMQLRSKFNQETTFLLARVFGSFTSNHTLLPYTIYTLADYKGSSETDVLHGSKVMELICRTILDNKSRRISKQCTL